MRRECYRKDFGPLSEGCTCYACQNYSRAYISQLLRDKVDTSAIQLISLHNVHFLIHLLRGLRESVLKGTTEEYAKDFFVNYFSEETNETKGKVPEWIVNAMKDAGIDLS